MTTAMNVVRKTCVTTCSAKCEISAISSTFSKSPPATDAVTRLKSRHTSRGDARVYNNLCYLCRFALNENWQKRRIDVAVLLLLEASEQAEEHPEENMLRWKRQRRYWVQSVNWQRQSLGDYHRLVQETWQWHDEAYIALLRYSY